MKVLLWGWVNNDLNHFRGERTLKYTVNEPLAHKTACSYRNIHVRAHPEGLSLIRRWRLAPTGLCERVWCETDGKGEQEGESVCYLGDMSVCDSVLQSLPTVPASFSALASQLMLASHVASSSTSSCAQRQTSAGNTHPSLQGLARPRDSSCCRGDGHLATKQNRGVSERVCVCVCVTSTH